MQPVTTQKGAAPESETRRRQNRWGEGELLRGEIVTAARRLLERDGTEAMVTLRGVAREADISAPSIYPHFANLGLLLEAVVAAALQELLDQMRAAIAELGEASSPRDRVRAYCRTYIEFGHRQPASYQIVFTRPHPSAMPQVRDAQYASFATFLRDVAAVRPDWSHDETRRHGIGIWTALHGLAILPPHHPRFEWPDTDLMLDNLLDLHLAAAPAALRPKS